MILSNEDIQEFADIYEGEYGERLSKEEASEIAWRFANLYGLLAEPLPSKQAAPPTPPSDETGSRSPQFTADPLRSLPCGAMRS